MAAANPARVELVVVTTTVEAVGLVEVTIAPAAATFPGATKCGGAAVEAA